MQFCDECGSMVKPDGEEFVCADCGHVQARADDADFVSTQTQQDDDVIESDGEELSEAKPRTDATCEACGNDEAYYTIKQTASADEPPTRFFKCTECGHRWRGYG
ncbi:MAG: transcription factor S [Halobacteriaceae archaeon]